MQDESYPLGATPSEFLDLGRETLLLIKTKWTRRHGVVIDLRPEHLNASTQARPFQECANLPKPLTSNAAISLGRCVVSRALFSFIERPLRSTSQGLSER